MGYPNYLFTRGPFRCAPLPLSPFPSPSVSLSLPLHRLLILVYGFLTAIGQDYPNGIENKYWPGSVVMGTGMLIIVGLLMCESWIRSKCCPKKALKYGVQAAR